MIVDFRVRPPLPSFRDHLIYASHLTPPPANKLGPLHWDRGESKSARQFSIELFFEEMDAAGIDRGVIMGRAADSSFGTSSNDEIAQFAADHSDRFRALAGIDGRNRDAVREVKEARANGFLGIAMDNGWCGLHHDDDSLFPVYDAAAEQNLIVALTSSQLMGDDLSFSHPDRVRSVAMRYPETTFVVSHACWPWTVQASALAFQCRNVLLLPDCYLNIRAAGWRDYVDSANSFMKSQMLYASAYPVRPMGTSLDSFRHLGLHEDAVQAALTHNPLRILDWE